LARLVIGAAGVSVVGLWAQSSSSIDTNLFRVINALPNGLDGAAKTLYALGSIWAVVVVVLVLSALRRWSVAGCVAFSGAGAWALAQVLNDALGSHSLRGLGVHLRTSSGPVFPSSNVAVFTALALVLSPYVVRPVHRFSLLVLVAVASSAMYLGVAFPTDVFGGLLLGLGIAGAVLFVFGAPGGRPTLEDVRDALGELGLSVGSVQHAERPMARAAVMDVTLGSGERLRVAAFGRDQRDGQFAERLWRRLAYRQPGVPAFGSRLQQVEHIGYMLLLAGQAHVQAPELVKTGVAGPDAAMLVTREPEGTRLSALDPKLITDAVLGAVWEQVNRLHGAGLSHGNLDTDHILVTDDRVALDGFTSADATVEHFWRDRESASVLVGSALLIGNDRAIRAAVVALGKECVGGLIPMVQPAAMPAGVRRGTKHLAKLLKELRADLATATGVEDVAPLKLQRLTLTNVGMLAGIIIALAIAIPGLANVNFSSVKSQFSNATWGWVVPAALLYPAILMAWATATTGAVNADLPFLPTVAVQLAASFLNLVTPNGIGGTVLQVDYLHRQDVPVASGTSAVILTTSVGGLIQMVLLVIAASLSASKLNFGKGGGSASLGIIALAAAAIGIVLLFPKIRGKVVPTVKRALSDVWSVLRNPRKALRLVGGNLAGNLLYPAALGLCLLAFHQSLGFAELIVVQMGAGLLASVTPVPGGIGIQEAALVSGLTGFGIPNNPALAAVMVFRTVTFVIPPFLGWLTLRWLRKQGYV
jgi:uncharacterized membrane protein YbhN (UPF0104 family)/membrane-associated phospholipid phosphatase